MAGTEATLITIHTTMRLATPAHRHLRPLRATGRPPSTIPGSRRNRLSIISSAICSRACKSWTACAALRRRSARSIPRSCTVWTNIRFTSAHPSARRPVRTRRTEAVCPRNHHRTTHRRCHYARAGHVPVPAPQPARRTIRRTRRKAHSMSSLRTPPFRH